MNKKLTLYKVTTTGPIGRYSPAFVVAPDPTAAYEKLLQYLNKFDYGFFKDRGLKSVEIIADGAYGYTPLLLLPEEGE